MTKTNKKNSSRPVQKFTKESLAYSLSLTPEQRIQFVEDFMKMAAYAEKSGAKSRLISIKIPEDLLQIFKLRCEAEGVAYQTQIKKLMRAFLFGDSG